MSSKSKKRKNKVQTAAKTQSRKARRAAKKSAKAANGQDKHGLRRVRSQRGSRKEHQVGGKHPHVQAARERVQKARETYHEKADVEVSVRGHVMEKGNIFKLAGLFAFFAIMVLLIVLLWPIAKDLFEPGGVDRVIADVKGAGPLGVLILLAMQFLQIVVAFIPGEVVQMAAGMMYGPWWGALIIFLGCVISSMLIYEVVHRLGAPFVQSMVPTKWLDKFRNFEASGKLLPIVFVLFFIPGLPKDVFTYLIPLTDMPKKQFIMVSCVARIPGIIVSTYAADGLVEGRIWESVVIFAVVGVVAGAGLLFRDRLMGLLDRFSKHER
ncbi:TVP38/TMEM64 family protein [Xiamenia xianingshaonis]|nr:VTT domain-containing protein [Xiamenia xianingshaonis]